MHKLADFTHHNARIVIALTVLFVVVAAIVGSPVVNTLSNGGYSDPHSQSEVAARALVRATGTASDPDIEVLAPRSDVAHVADVVRRVPGVARVQSPLDAADPSTLVSRDGTRALVMAFLDPNLSGNDQDAAARDVQDRLRNEPGVIVGGPQLTFDRIDSELSSDLPRIEIVAFSILLLLSLIAFRGLVAALLPLFVGAVAVAGSLLVMRALSQVTTLSVYSLNLVTGLGLGLAIDYSLFVVFRYREELHRRGHCPDALRVTLATAGRTVCFSSITVTLALLSLLVFPQKELSSMGIAAAVVTTLAAAAALVPLGAMLALLGPRVNALAPHLLHRARERAARPSTDGHWYRLATAVMHRAVPVALGCAALLLCIGLPVTQLNLGSIDSRALPAGAPPRTLDQIVASDFAAQPDTPYVVLARAPDDAGPALAAYASRLDRLPGAAAVTGPQRIDDGLWRIDVLGSATALSHAGQQLVASIRGAPAPYPVESTGTAAEQYDLHASLKSHTVIAFAWLAVTTILVLFLMTGSVVLPIKSLIMNLLTLSGAFGILVLVFQDGHLEGLLDFTSTGSLEQTNMIILAIIAFGLSTDYGVFLLARIKEAHDGGASNNEAVAIGLERSGRVVTAAAVLFCAAIGSLIVSDLVFLKEFGLGAALAVFIDATIIRALLVPALMALLGRANWWAPGPLRRLVYRAWAHGLAEEPAERTPPSAPLEPIDPTDEPAPAVPAAK